jgi:16S rRNA (cytidine1402-2'-O)-methyltransferase
MGGARYGYVHRRFSFAEGGGPSANLGGAMEPAAESGILTVAATPIGQPGDASARLISALASAPVIAAEDTRRIGRLAAALGISLPGRLVSYYDDVEARRVPALLADLLGGTDVLLVSDAGLPGISYPGYRLVAAAAAAGVRVTALPGPTAVTTALAISGLPTDRFVFEGFLPRRAGDRARRLAGLAAEQRTLVLYESPRRLDATLAELAGAFGAARRAVVCRELTKTYEQVARGTLAELAALFAAGARGEITIVVEGAGAVAPAITLEDAAAAAIARARDGEPRNVAIAAVAKQHGLPRRAVYDAVVRAGQ